MVSRCSLNRPPPALRDNPSPLPIGVNFHHFDGTDRHHPIGRTYLTTNTVRFPGQSGLELAGRLELPDDGAPTSCAVFAHCFTCSKDIRAAVRISRELAAQGMAVLRFDFTGIGESEGEFADSHFGANVGDLIAAAAFLERLNSPPSLLIGHSLGGAAVLRAAGSLPSVKGICTIGAPADPSHVEHLLVGAREALQQADSASVSIAGREFTITREFLEALENQPIEAAAGALRAALLIFHSPTDTTVGIENAARIYQAARHPKSFVSLDGADHLLTRPEDAEYVARVLGAWAGRYLTRHPPVS